MAGLHKDITASHNTYAGEPARESSSDFEVPSEMDEIFAEMQAQTSASARTSGSGGLQAPCVRVLGDNRCLFRALVRQLPSEFDGPRDLLGKSLDVNTERAERFAADQLRDKVCDYMKDHVTDLQYPVDVFGGQDPDDYIARMRVPSTWGGDTEIHVVHLCTGRCIRVWRPCQGTFLLMVNHGEADPRDANVIDVVWVSKNHYDIFLPWIAFPETFSR